MNSIWTATADMPSFAPLDGDLNTDTLILGGGMAGLLCAHYLDRAGVDYALVEAGRLCGGVTGNTTAKLTFQHGLLYGKLLRTFGPERARLYLEANRAALGRFRELCRDIDCDFQERDAYVYAGGDCRELDRELEALSRLGFPAELVRTPELPMPTAGALKFPKQAQFHPLKFAAAIARDLRIFEDTKVLELGRGTAVTNRGTIRAKRMIVATHFPLLNKHGAYFLKLYQHRSYVLALENAGSLPGMYVDQKETGLSFRNSGELLLLGGGGHRTGKPGGGWRELENFAQRHYPQTRIAARWATQDCMTLDGVPYVGQYSRRTEGLYVATGFNKWGMTSSMAAAELLADLLLGRANPYEELFCPSRSVLRPQLAANAWQSALGLLTPTAPRCPHMGCALKYNAQEHSWDCPCHGSRFGEDGELLDNPATDDKRM
ncbi:MAG: FAD-dependent oxidoreductase [Oscillibacter sp.]|jgi:glycine/D-amino acid oxidase-like deaminating enzyme|nr:FAD-dependent oxidoreductase [Oscillibacter sp.]MCI9001769.1 FAD-dependent oxidoreductase [Oscillibacter sp.]